MKTIELTLMSIAVGMAYASFVYYLLTRNNDPRPSGLWATIGSTIDEFFFNSGLKPKQSIMDGPNKIQEWTSSTSPSAQQ